MISADAKKLRGLVLTSSTLLNRKTSGLTKKKFKPKIKKLVRDNFVCARERYFNQSPVKWRRGQTTGGGRVTAILSVIFGKNFGASPQGQGKRPRPSPLSLCGGFCDRFISFLVFSRVPRHPSQFQVFLISSVSLSSLLYSLSLA